MPCTGGCTCHKHDRVPMSREDYLIRHAASEQRRRKTDPRRSRSIQMKSTFGITLDDYELMLDAQGGLCAICGTDKSGGKGRFHIDHNHDCCLGKTSCGKCIRGLLCTRCNVGIAMFQDNVIALGNAVTYLARF